MASGWSASRMSSDRSMGKDALFALGKWFEDSLGISLPAVSWAEY